MLIAFLIVLIIGISMAGLGFWLNDSKDWTGGLHLAAASVGAIIGGLIGLCLCC